MSHKDDYQKFTIGKTNILKKKNYRKKMQMNFSSLIGKTSIAEVSIIQSHVIIAQLLNTAFYL